MATKDRALRLPPQHIEAEESLLGACLLDNTVIDDCSEVCEPTDLYRDAHQTCWAAILDLREQGQPVDGVTLADYLARRGEFDKVGGDDFLLRITTVVPHAANALYYAGIIREKADNRRLIEAASRILEAGYSNEETAADLICWAEQEIFAISERSTGANAVPSETLMQEALARIEQRRQGHLLGIATGYEDLDGTLLGLQGGQLCILAARPSMGKTALALGISDRVASRGQNVLFVSLEMPRHQIAERLLSMRANVCGDLIRWPASMTFRNSSAVVQAAREIGKLPLLVDDGTPRTLRQIAATARRIKRRSSLGMVVIDYLSLIDAPQHRGENRQEVVAKLSRALKSTARQLHVPMLVLHQINRQAEARQDGRPRMSDLRESGQIEADADIIMILHRPEQFRAGERPGEADLDIAKNRNGATGIVKLTFRKELASFESMAPARLNQQQPLAADDDWTNAP
jgi:replicative DNA helicase